jgi:hypothetical protein
MKKLILLLFIIQIFCINVYSQKKYKYYSLCTNIQCVKIDCEMYSDTIYVNFSKNENCYRINSNYFQNTFNIERKYKIYSFYNIETCYDSFDIDGNYYNIRFNKNNIVITSKDNQIIIYKKMVFYE